MNTAQNRVCLILAALCLSIQQPLVAQPKPSPVLERNVSVNFQKVPLESALRTLRQRYGVNLSYSNTALDLRQSVTLRLQNQPLRTVLNNLLRDTNVSYQLVGNQVVLHPAPTKPTTVTALATGATASTAAPVRTTEARSTPVEPAANSKPAPQTISAKPASVPSKEASKPAPRKPTSATNPLTSNKSTASSTSKNTSMRAASGATEPSPSDSNGVTASTAPATAALNQSAPQPAADSVGVAAAVSATKPEPEEAAHETITKPAQVSFFWPLGSNGFSSGRTVNKVSLNVLAGYQAGVDGFEAASLLNVDRYNVKGAQVAGVGNVVGQQLTGFQGAGVLNVLGGEANGWQAAGVLNLARRAVHGGQAAGVFNATLGEVRGVQAAGVFNVARSVHGVQLAGVVNIADSVDGISIAPFNLVRHGYHRLEVTNSETWPVSAALKLGGSAAFYTFVTGAYDDFGSGPRRWALGYGVGTEAWSRKRLSLALDAVAMHVNEEQRGWTDELNLHNQVRVLLGFAPFKAGSHLRIVAGPTASVLVTQRYDSGEQKIYSNLTKGHKLWLNEGSARTRVFGWFGYSAGIRF
ncbi:DUF4974 domain-containing protein [Hymenobacter sp. GOD-10R]|uniref:DUF4974 domain-containing protein n=1 Tax=Hymenobacter sp. GOD-10R TaxID=3093922 RepID=UPI002D7691D0|nr:secretin and TonB N-terminal domain-containing protein [Hymenobacter sp. GOD-10R]WRQ28817.1 secretin and TonB N-terminal domain-containing protein [Hymenobacter sp. GOD-10R]